MKPPAAAPSPSSPIKGRTWAKGLERRRPGPEARPFVLLPLAEALREARLKRRRLDPTANCSSLLSQNSADVNAERAFAGLRAAFPSGGAVRGARSRQRLGRGLISPKLFY